VAIGGKQKYLSVKAMVSPIPRIKTLPITVMTIFGMTVKPRHNFFYKQGFRDIIRAPDP
jgi:hypothetical protein